MESIRPELTLCDEAMLCEKCQQHEATVHTTNVNGDEVSTVNLCEECFRAAEPRRACKRCAKGFYGYWEKTVPFAAR